MTPQDYIDKSVDLNLMSAVYYAICDREAKIENSRLWGAAHRALCENSRQSDRLFRAFVKGHTRKEIEQAQAAVKFVCEKHVPGGHYAKILERGTE